MNHEECWLSLDALRMSALEKQLEISPGKLNQLDFETPKEMPTP